jgi:hypothetical protein
MTPREYTHIWHLRDHITSHHTSGSLEPEGAQTRRGHVLISMPLRWLMVLMCTVPHHILLRVNA